MWASTLLSPYLHPKIRSLTFEFYKSSHTNAGCALAYIPSLVGVASVWAVVLRRGNRAMHGEVAPYILAKISLSLFLKSQGIGLILLSLLSIALQVETVFKCIYSFKSCYYSFKSISLKLLNSLF